MYVIFVWIISILFVLILFFFSTTTEHFNDNIEIKDEPCSFKLSEASRRRVDEGLRASISSLKKDIEAGKSKIEDLESNITQMNKRKDIEIQASTDLVPTDVFDEKQTDAKLTGKLSGSAEYITNAYIRLTSLVKNSLGYVYWNTAAGTNWKCTFEWRVGGGNDADATWFFVYQDKLPATEFEIHGGYNFVCDEWDSGDGTYGNDQSSLQIHGPQGNNSNSDKIQTDGNYITHIQNLDFNMCDERWRRVDIYFNCVNSNTNHMQMFIDNKMYIDTKHTLPKGINIDYDVPKLMGFAARTGGNYNNHDIRNMRFTRFAEDKKTEKGVDEGIVKDINTMNEDLSRLRHDHANKHEQLKAAELRLEGLSKTNAISIDGFMLPRKNRYTGMHYERLNEGDFVGNLSRCYANVKDDDEYNRLKERVKLEHGDNIHIQRREIIDRVEGAKRQLAEATFLTSDVSQLVSL